VIDDTKKNVVCWVRPACRAKKRASGEGGLEVIRNGR